MNITYDKLVKIALGFPVGTIQDLTSLIKELSVIDDLAHVAKEDDMKKVYTCCTNFDVNSQIGTINYVPNKLPISIGKYVKKALTNFAMINALPNEQLKYGTKKNINLLVKTIIATRYCSSQNKRLPLNIDIDSHPYQHRLRDMKTYSVDITMNPLTQEELDMFEFLEKIFPKDKK